MTFLGLIPASVRSSLLWAAAAIAGGIALCVVVTLLHTPSKVTLATRAADAQCNTKQIQLALVAAEERNAVLKETLEARARHDKSKDEANTKLSASVESLKAENESLKKPRPDDSTPPLDPLDPWLLRNSKGSTTNPSGAKAR
jgi:acyl-CoA synthetase (AMP-forming)/AMP-acid ligase II